MLVLVGFMGAGKTTVGRLVASELGLPFVDTDDVVAGRAGMSVPRIFVEQGEARFRELERGAVASALAGPEAVVALGGGALGDPVTRAEVEWAKVIHLDVSFMEAMRRMGTDHERPLLRSSDPKALFDERQSVYASARDMVVMTDGRRPKEIATEVASLAGFRRVEHRSHKVVVQVSSPYAVTIGADLLNRTAQLVPLPEAARKAVVISHPELSRIADVVTASLTASGLETSLLDVPAGESSKSLARAGELLDALARIGLHRSDVIVAVGGGVVTDVVGFVASTYKRGLALVNIPTTLLGQVDAAIGGKTAVNLAAGKNLAGTFHQPCAVVCDVAVLKDLPARDFTSGLAEVAKYGFIRDGVLLETLRDKAAALAARDVQVLEEIVRRSVEIKAAVVAADERDTGMRAILNYGHTVGHALEHARQGSVTHGEAVALGMMAAAYAAEEIARIDAAAVELHREVLTRLGLPVTVETTLDELAPYIAQDKKHDGDELGFVLLRSIGEAEAAVRVERDVLERALKRMAG